MKLEVKIKKRFKGFVLDVDFVTEAQTIGLLGGSGSGKSMTLRCIAGLLTPDEGYIIFNNRVLYDHASGVNLPPQDRKIGFLFQNYALFPHMTVEENVLFGLTHLNKEQRHSQAMAHLERVQMTHLSRSYPAQLSGGQQQRVAIARAMAIEPDILILDEPFSALDHHLRTQMEHEVKSVLEAYGHTAIVVSHDINELYRISDEILVYDAGRILGNGDKEVLFTEPRHIGIAKITGCKNIGRIVSKVVGKLGNEVTIGKWQMSLELGQELTEDHKFIGIRAHHFISHLPDTKDERENLLQQRNHFAITIKETVISPFRVMIYFTVSEEGHISKNLQWDLSRERYDIIRDRLDSLVLEVPRERILILEE